ncbi:MAG: threonine synthase, partial [Gammaproteobacteria bacterium]|nr:threonine synthase [Gammaproteobacteria bacterium]
MYYKSTRNTDLHKTLSQAILSGLAEDGGLFIPEFFPKINLKTLLPKLAYSDFAKDILHPYFENDFLDTHLAQIC